MDRRSGRNADKRGLDEEAEKLLKDSDTQDSSAGGHCSSLYPDPCAMFRSRQEHEKGASGGRNKDVNIPLVRDRDGDETAAIKRKTSSARESTAAEESRDEEAVQAQENKRRKRRIMKIAVYVMFGVIALGVFAIWLFHRDTVDAIRFNNKFTFTVKVQTLEIKTDDQEGLLYGELGRSIKAAPFDNCWDKDTKTHDDNCVYWKHKGYLRAWNDNVTGNCYTLRWQSLSTEFLADDCFYLQKHKWYGYLLPNQPFWPVEDVQVKNEAYYSQYPEQKKINLIPSWLGSQGIALFVHSSFPFTISWNNTEKRQFCITSELELLEDRQEEDGPVDQLTYTICQGKNLRDVYYNAQRYRHSWEAELKKTPHTIQPLMWPLLTISSNSDILPLLTMLRTNRTHCSFLQLPLDWEKRFGDLQFNESLLYELRSLISLAKEKGCGIVLPISTFFTYNSRLFQEGIENQYFLRDELNLVTKMVHWRNLEGAVLDSTNHEAVHWYLDHVNVLLQNITYNIQALKLLHIDVPRDANFYDINMTFLDYSRLVYRDASVLLNVTLILEQAMGFVSEPVFVSLRTKVSEVEDAQCFNSVIPWALNLGMNGYPLIVADGSDLLTYPNLTAQLVKRWLQLAIFFPAFQIPNLPLLKTPELSRYMDTLMTSRADILAYMHKEWAADQEAPILRPLWWRNPQDRTAQMISDQFLVGNRLLVAPILCNPATHRNVYLPEGKWQSKSYRGNETHVGPKTVRISNFNNQLVIFWEVSDKK